MWVTPIMWNFDSITGMPGWMRKVFMLNPLFYIIQGYRDSLADKIWFFERPLYTLYFWALTFGIFAIGVHLFKKLKVHFADVL